MMTTVLESTQELEERVRRARGGDRDAFGELVAGCYSGACVYAQSLLRDAHRAQDVVQEALLIAYTCLDRLEDPSAFEAWVRGIVFRRCHRVLRAPDVRDLPALAPAPAASAEALAIEAERAAWLHERIAALPSSEREVVNLYYLRGCSQREVAAFLELPPTTVNNRLHTARQRLKSWRHPMTGTTITAEPESARVGTICALDGPLVDVRFDPQTSLDVLDALAVADASGRPVEGLKIAQRRGDGAVRCVVTRPEVPLSVGLKVLNTGALGVGPSPGAQPVACPSSEAVTQTARHLAARHTGPVVLRETGIKAVDLFCPLPARGVVAQTGVPGVGRLVLLEELIARGGESPLSVVCLVERLDPGSIRGVLEPGVDYTGEVAPELELLWVLADGANDPDFPALAEFQAVMHCTPLLAIQGLYPALDPLRSSSTLLREAIVGARQVETARRAQVTLTRARELTVDPGLLEHLACRAFGAARRRALRTRDQDRPAWSQEERTLVGRARRLERYLTQPFTVAESFTGLRGCSVPRETTVADVEAILDGAADDLPLEALLYGADLASCRALAEQGTPPRDPFGSA